MLRKILIDEIKTYLTDNESLDEEIGGLFAIFQMKA